MANNKTVVIKLQCVSEKKLPKCEESVVIKHGQMFTKNGKWCTYVRSVLFTCATPSSLKEWLKKRVCHFCE